MNSTGRTVFIEDNCGWLNEVTYNYPYLTAFHVTFDTKLSEWREFLDVKHRRMPRLPETLIKEHWDIVLVDGPAGNKDPAPGRMQSILAASELTANGGHCFVHDCNREIEAALTDALLGHFTLRSDDVMREYACTRR